MRSRKRGGRKENEACSEKRRCEERQRNVVDRCERERERERETERERERERKGERGPPADPARPS